MFQNLRWRLLLYQLSVIAALLGIFGIAVYGFVTRSLYQQIDKKLMTLAQSATLSLSYVQGMGDGYFEQVDEVPWRDIFNRDRQTIEWFDAEGALLSSRGSTEIFSKVTTGAQTATLVDGSLVRTFTVTVFEDQPIGEPTPEGYVRASQSMEDIQMVRNQLLMGLGLGGGAALALAGVGGLWLTQRSLRPVEASYRQLKQFTADASHELRGPLTAIQMSVDVMQNHPERIHPKDVKKIGAIASATTQMSYLAEDLLLLARMDVGKSVIPRERQPVDLAYVLRELLILLEHAAKEKGISLTLCCAKPVSTLGDAAQLNRLFSNLLNNALQYTPPGGAVMVTLLRQRRNAIVRVEDTGAGIAPADLPFIFDRFWRADKARTQRAGGCGLGLAIAKAIVQQHQGRITVKSSVGVGSCFQVSLPAIERP